nr:hypothetical protein [Tanacetum cinerariifolium]
MIPNVDEASTSHNVFNERLEDAYFDASTSFHDPSNVHIFYQPYPHEKKLTKDHPLHKIIGDPKSSVRTRGQLANTCLFSCLLSFIEPANVAEVLRDADWVSAMQEELDQFARLKIAGTDKFSKLINFLHRQLHREALSRIRASLSMTRASVVTGGGPKTSTSIRATSLRASSDIIKQQKRDVEKLAVISREKFYTEVPELTHL